MGCSRKNIILTILDQEHVRKDWFFDFDGAAFQDFFDALAIHLDKMGIELTLKRNAEVVIKVNSYADLLNVVKISSPQDDHSNHCIGHNIGKSENLDILEDIEVAVRRISFAHETIAPSGEFRKVCHNCGCGC
jgi:hypothetical protein